MFNLKSIYPVGIDIGEENIYAAQVRPTRKGLAVRGMVHRRLEVEAAGEDEISEALLPLIKEISKHKQFVGKRAVVHIPSKLIFSFPIRFQVEASESLEEAMVRKSKEYLPFPIEEAIMDYPSLIDPSSSENKQYKTTIIAVHREHISKYLKILKKAGYTVEAVDFGVISLFRLHRYLHESTTNPVILCNIDYSDSLITVVTDNTILADRHISWGIERLIEKMQENLGLSKDDDARTFLREYGLIYESRIKTANGDNPPEDMEAEDLQRAIYQIITPYCEELVDEFLKVISYLRSEEGIAVFDGIYVYGQGIFLNHLDSYIEKRINIPTELINPMTGLGPSRNGILTDIYEGAPFSLALGLAMRKVAWL